MDHSLIILESIRYIDRNLDRPIGLSNLSEQAHLSKYHFHRLFRKMVGSPVNRYIGARRMERAADELTETEKPILDIAFQYQYGSQEAFTRAFRRKYGITPARYRRLHLKRGPCNVISFRTSTGRTQDMAA